MPSLWDGQVVVEAPAGLKARVDGDAVLLRSVDGLKAPIRLSLIELEPSAGTAGRGREYVRQEAARRGLEPGELQAVTLLISNAILVTDVAPVYTRQWLVGGRDQIVVIDCAIREDDQGSDEAKQLLDQLDAMARSLRFARQYAVFAAGQAKPSKEPTPNDLLPTIRPPTDDEQAEVDRQAEAGFALLDRYAPGDEHEEIFHRLEAAFEAWKQDDSADSPTRGQTAEGFGALFGMLLNSYFDSQWAIIIDGRTSELAVRHPATGAMLLPIELLRRHRPSGRGSRLLLRTRNVLEQIIETEGAGEKGT